MLATVINIHFPALAFLAAATGLGVLLATVSGKVAVSSLLASALVVVGFLTLKQYLPLEFRVYARDLIYEPILRDRFLISTGEGIASAAFHFVLPYLFVAGLMRLIQRTKAQNDTKQA